MPSDFRNSSATVLTRSSLKIQLPVFLQEKADDASGNRFVSQLKNFRVYAVFRQLFLDNTQARVGAALFVRAAVY
jgi:hypothetical protein